MEIYSWIIGNEELLKFVYTVIIGLVCFVIVLKTDRLFRLSLHQGIRYFRNAFFFYGLAFIVRYLFSEVHFFSDNLVYNSITRIMFEFFLIMAGFSLLYSLLWKKLDIKKESVSSLFNAKIFVFYGLALVIAFLDYLWQTYYFMFASQIILFSYASVISCINCKRSKKQQIFLKLYSVVIVLNLVAWISNFAIATIFNWNKIGVINIYILNVIIFLLLLYGVVMVTKKARSI